MRPHCRFKVNWRILQDEGVHVCSNLDFSKFFNGASEILICSSTVPSFIQVAHQDGECTVVHVTNSVQTSNLFQVRSAHAREHQMPISLKSSQWVKTTMLPVCWLTTCGLGTTTRGKKESGSGTTLACLGVTQTGMSIRTETRNQPIMATRIVHSFGVITNREQPGMTGNVDTGNGLSVREVRMYSLLEGPGDRHQFFKNINISP